MNLRCESERSYGSLKDSGLMFYIPVNPPAENTKDESMIEIAVKDVEYAEASRRYHDSQRRRIRAEAAKEAADREFKYAKTGEAQDMLLVLDMKDQAAGIRRVISTGLYIDSYGAHACASKTADGQECGGLVPTIRAVVLLDDRFVSAVFCQHHKRHAVHYGVQECAQCGSEKLVEHDPNLTKTPAIENGCYEYEASRDAQR